MYLKRLDVHGFKSFANRTQMQFTPGVTCIIGPNGCGKTNVADSIRWVLGEHASRTLRARKTEDVIFAGSDRRAPMGVAEVAITLDNSKHWLPIEFDEVVVSRRAYRSGENEYLINGSKVRLRDVVELFMRAQVGQNSYAFMGQGMVEQVLSLRPEDRRALIEEAADVRLYRQKLDDARKKLKETRENVDRVRMLVREIEPRINQLERQAGRAAKYRELAQELAASLQVYYELQWRTANDQLLAAITTQDQRGEDVQHLRAEARALEDGIGQLRTAIDARKGEIVERERRLHGLDEYARDLERRVALDEERTATLEARAAELQAEVESLEADLAAQQADSRVTDTADLEARLAEARSGLAESRNRLEATERETLALHRAVLAHEQEVRVAGEGAAEAARRAEAAADLLRRLRLERDAAIEQHHIHANDSTSLEDEAARLRQDARDAASGVDRTLAERRRETDLLAAHREQTRAIEDDVHLLREALQHATARLDVLRELDVRPQAPDAGIRAVLEAAGLQPRELTTPDLELTGVVGLVHQLVRGIPQGLEQAISVALAENYYAVVFERAEDMHAAVRLLLDHDFGRVTMFALDAFHEHRPLHIMKERGVLGVASSMVRSDSRHRKLVDTLLGRTVVVENIDLAQRYIRRGLAHAVATVDGVLVRPIGSMLAGAPSAEHAAFSLQRQAGDLPEELARLQPELEQKETALADHAARQAAAERRLEELAAAADAARERKAGADALVAAAEARLAAHAPRTAALEEAIAALEGRIAAAQDDLQRDESAAASFAEGRTRAAAAHEDALARVSPLEAARDALASDVNEAAAHAAHLEGQLRTERSVTQGERLALERLRRQITEKTQQRQAAEGESRSIGGRLAVARRELDEKTAERASLGSDVQPAREELAQLESRERSMAAQLAEVGERVRTAERALVEAEADVRVRSEEREHIRASLEDEGFEAGADGDVRRVEVAVAAPAEAAASGGTPADGDEADDGRDAAPGDPPAWLLADGDVPPVRGGAVVDVVELRDRIAELRGQIRGLGPINEDAATEYGESRERFDYLTAQLVDLGEAEGQLLDAIGDLDREIRDRFRVTFKLVNTEFERYFSAFFRGGTARLELGEADEDGLPGIEIVAQPPGKKLGSLALLSGGERSLTAVALLFALLQANPSPICVLDEVDAALDEANVGRFVEELRALSQKTQFIIITHNRRTIENADTIYGVSMGADSVSRVLGLRLDQVQIPDD